MKIRYRKVRLSKENLIRLDQINGIIEEYQDEGYTLTLRQLYYQLVSRDIVPNKQAEYSKLSTLLKEGRMGGIVDWDAIEDRLRKPYSPSSWDNPSDALDSLISQYQLPRMQGQENYLEVWVEKDALSGVLKRVTKMYHVPILVNRGYSSVSAMFDSYKRFKHGLREANSVTILYLGDFDPSGMDMIRDIEDRTNEFAERDYDYFPLNVIPIALTMDQIKMYEPPPNPAKITDPRAAKYIEEYGDTSWEVDALPPNVLHKLLEESIKGQIDIGLYLDIVSKEEADKEKLNSLKKQL
jgi:hypothetical protein